MPIVYNNAKTYYSCIERINEYVKEYNSPIEGFNSLEVLLYKDFTKNLEEKLKKQQYKEIWQQYCGFLDLSMNGYMKIQRRLMEEQVKLWSNCGLGQSILKGKHPQNLDEFRKMVPLTTYDDYADILLAKQPDMLPGNPVIWIQTTWEG